MNGERRPAGTTGRRHDFSTPDDRLRQEADTSDELALLDAAMQHPAITATAGIEPKHFADGSRGAIWAALTEVHTLDLKPEPTTVLARAQQHARVDPAIFTELSGWTVPIDAERYAAKVRDGYARRETADRIRSAEQLLLAGKPLADVHAKLADLSAADDVVQPRSVIAPIDWLELFADDTEEEFILYPLIPERRHIALYSEAKIGKSLLMLEIGVAVSRGRPVLGFPTRQQTVLYIDFENDPRGDIRARLEDMGHGPADLANLIYLSFPTMAALNTYEGGQQLLANALHHKVGLVIIDTVSRAIDGEENSNDTWLGLYAHTGLKLKQAGIAMVRLDHAGKDVSRGQRGGSAKAGDVDAVWSLAKLSDDTFKLECSHHRFMLAGDDTVLTLYRRTDPLRHDVNHGTAAVLDAKVAAVLADLDRLQVPAEWGRRKIRTRFKEAGVKHGNAALEEALRHRKNVPGARDQPALPDRAQHDPGHTPDSTPENVPGAHSGHIGAADSGGCAPALRSTERGTPEPPPIQRCTICGFRLSAAVVDDGFNTHPACDPEAS